MNLWDPKQYAEHNQPQYLVAAQFLKQLQAAFTNDTPPGSTILDIGCGEGSVTSCISNHFASIKLIGVDASEAMINYAKKQFSSTELQFEVDRAETLSSVPDKSVHGITSFSCLHWVRDLNAAFQAMNRVLCPGGWIGLSFGANTEHLNPLKVAYFQALEELYEVKLDKSQVLPDQTDIEKALKKSGFLINTCASTSFSYDFENQEAFKSWLQAWFIKIKMLPPKIQEECLDRTIQIYGNCQYIASVLQITGRADY